MTATLPDVDLLAEHPSPVAEWPAGLPEPAYTAPRLSDEDAARIRGLLAPVPSPRWSR